MIFLKFIYFLSDCQDFFKGAVKMEFPDLGEHCSEKTCKQLGKFPSVLTWPLCLGNIQLLML